MNSHTSGFIKRAKEYGLDDQIALRMYKNAIAKEDEQNIHKSNLHKKDSTSIGRYLDTKAQRSQAFMDHPFEGTVGKGVGTLGGGLAGGGIGAGVGGGLGALIASLSGGDVGDAAKGGAVGGGLVGGGIGSYLGNHVGGAMGSQGLSKEKRERTLQSSSDNLKHRSLLSNVGHSGLNMGAMGALGGGLAGLALPHQGADGNTDLAAVLKNILGGGAVGGLAGGMGGGLSGGINSMIHKETSDETHKRSKNLLAKHPVGTALPFGDVVGAVDA